MPTYLWVNQKTREQQEILTSVEKRDVPPDDSGDWFRPMVPVVFTKVSYRDGATRDDQSSYNKLKMASQLEIDKASSVDKNERTRLQTEINKLTKA